VAAQLKPFALKFFFSNQYLYASIQRRVDGRVSARLRAGPILLEPPHSNRLRHLDADVSPRHRTQIVAAASTFEKSLRDALPSRTDESAADKIGVSLSHGCRRALLRTGLPHLDRSHAASHQASCWLSGARRWWVTGRCCSRSPEGALSTAKWQRL
jgi:hypothetical protein